MTKSRVIFLGVNTLAVLAILVVVLPTPARAVIFIGSDPQVVEAYDGIDEIEYTVVNPGDSTVGEIIAFAVEFNPAEVGEPEQDALTSTYTTNGWAGQTLVDFDYFENWTRSMRDGKATMELSWQEMFGGLSFPGTTSYATGYFLPYSASEVAGEYLLDDPELAVLLGQSLAGFFARAGGLESLFHVAYLNDASATFTTGDLQTFTGEAIPEPATVVLLLVGAIGVAVKTRRRC